MPCHLTPAPPSPPIASSPPHSWSPEATGDKDLGRTCLSQRPGQGPRQPTFSLALFPQGNSGHLQGAHMPTQSLSLLNRMSGQGFEFTSVWEIPMYEKKLKDLRKCMIFRDTMISISDSQTPTHPIWSQTNSPCVETRSLLPQCFYPTSHTLSCHVI